MPYTLAIDLGTSKLAAVLLDADTLDIAGSVRVGTKSDLQSNAPGVHEQDPLIIEAELFDMIPRLIRHAGIAPEEITGIAFAGQMHGVILVDPATFPLTPFITWRDRRSEGVIERIPRGQWAVRTTGCHLRVGYGGATLAALAQDVPIPIYARALSLADFIVARWSGWIGTEPCHAASWGLLDIHSLQWHADSIKQLGLPSSVLPRVVPSLTGIGTIKPEAAEKLGVSANAKIYSPIGDHQATCWAAGPTQAKGLMFNLGTGGQVCWFSSRSEVINGLETRPNPGGGYLLVGASTSGGWAYQYLARFYQRVVHELGYGHPSLPEIFERMTGLHGQVSPPLPKVDPSFQGTRSAPDRQGTISDIDAENFTPANLAAAFSAGIVRELVEMVPMPILRRASLVTAGGSGFRKNPWAIQLLQDHFGTCPIVLLPETKDAALGAGLAAVHLNPIVA